MKRDRVIIKLAEIPDEGREYFYDRSTGELDQSLADLIDDNFYEAEFIVRPVGNVYDVAGHIETELDRVCSRCGNDIKIPIKAKINEILIAKPHDEKGDTQSKRGFLGSENTNEVSVTYISGGALDAGEMIHEIIGLAEDPYPTCKDGECLDLDEINRKLNQLQRDAEKAMGVKENPFDVLKKLKLE